MQILSLFDGMACGMLAMQAAGIAVDRYVAYEIDKYAVQTSSHNFPMIEHRGDVFKADFTEFFGFDFVIGGSPCTFWSIAQKNNRETEASGMGWELFSQYVRAVREAKPRWFIYENNKSMSKAIRKSIDETFGFEAVEINSKLVSAQNRQRLYWVGKRNADGTYSKVNVELPEDRGILLKDILESGCIDKEKAYCLKHQAGNARDYFKKHHTQIALEPVGTTKDGKSYCLTAGYANGGGEKIGNYAAHTLTKGCKSMAAEPVNVTADGKGCTVRSQYAKTAIANIFNSKGKMKFSASGAAECVPGCAIPCEWDEEDRPIKAISCADGKVYTVYEVKDGKITIKGKTYPIKLKDGYYIIRKLTVRECMRLQTVPEWYEFPVSDTQAYKMLGNGWTVLVIAHLIEATQKENCAPVYTWHTGAQLSGQMSFDELLLFA